MQRIHVSSRDSARTPVQWSDAPNAGFTDAAEPWFYVNQNYREVNVAAQEGDPDSILNFYRRALALRRNSDTLLFGDYREWFPRSPKLYMYERSLAGERVLVVISFRHFDFRYQLPEGFPAEGCELLLSNYPEPQLGTLRPYEAQVWRWKQCAGR